MKSRFLLFFILILSLVTVAHAETFSIDRFVTACNGINVSFTTPANTVPNIACADPTGGRLRSDDGLQESFQSAKGFLGSSAGGVQATALNTSITDCQQITKVQVCVDRDGISILDDSCVSHVDLNGDGVFGTFDGFCNNGYWNNTFNCYDVTSVESGYSCANVFSGSTGFRAKSFSYRGVTNGFRTVTHDQLWFNVTYNNDIPPPIGDDEFILGVVLSIINDGFFQGGFVFLMLIFLVTMLNSFGFDVVKYFK